MIYPSNEIAKFAKVGLSNLTYISVRLLVVKALIHRFFLKENDQKSYNGPRAKNAPGATSGKAKTRQPPSSRADASDKMFELILILGQLTYFVHDIVPMVAAV